MNTPNKKLILFLRFYNNNNNNNNNKTISLQIKTIFIKRSELAEERNNSKQQLEIENVDLKSEIENLRAQKDRLEEALKFRYLQNEEFDSATKSLEKSNLISNLLIISQKKLINELEDEANRIGLMYSKLVDTQRRLIALLEIKYDELLHSLIDSFNDIDTSTESNKMEEIQSDLNNLIDILGTSLYTYYNNNTK